MKPAIATQHEILQSIWDFAAALPGDDARLDRICRQLGPQHDLLVHLQERYWAEDLIDARLVVSDGNGLDGDDGEEGGANVLTLVESLATDGALVFAVRNDRFQMTDLVTEYGTISGRAPALAMLDDAGLGTALGTTRGMLFLALTVNDLLWLLRAELPAILCPGTESLTLPLMWNINRHARRILNKQLGRRPPPKGWACGDHAAADAHERDLEAEDLIGLGAMDPPSTPLLVSVAWSPCTGALEPPPGLSGRLQLLAVSQRTSIHFPEICIWTPAAAEWSVFESLQELGISSQVRQAVLESVEQSGRELHSCGAAPDVSLIEARRQFRAGLELVRTGLLEYEDFYNICATFTKVIERDLGEPLLLRATACSDAVRRLMFFSLAEMAHQFHDSAMEANWKLVQAKWNRGSDNAAKRLLGNVKQIAAIAKLLS